MSSCLSVILPIIWALSWHGQKLDPVITNICKPSNIPVLYISFAHYLLIFDLFPSSTTNPQCTSYSLFLSNFLEVPSFLPSPSPWNFLSLWKTYLISRIISSSLMALNIIYVWMMFKLIFIVHFSLLNSRFTLQS